MNLQTVDLGNEKDKKPTEFSCCSIKNKWCNFQLTVSMVIIFACVFGLLIGRGPQQYWATLLTLTIVYNMPGPIADVLKKSEGIKGINRHIDLNHGAFSITDL